MARTKRRVLALAAAAALVAVIGGVPAGADCLRATATYRSPSGQTTTVGSSCVSPTPFQGGVNPRQEVGRSEVGSVIVDINVPTP